MSQGPEIDYEGGRHICYSLSLLWMGSAKSWVPCPGLVLRTRGSLLGLGFGDMSARIRKARTVTVDSSLLISACSARCSSQTQG